MIRAVKTGVIRNLYYLAMLVDVHKKMLQMSALISMRTRRN